MLCSIDTLIQKGSSLPNLWKRDPLGPNSRPHELYIPLWFATSISTSVYAEILHHWECIKVDKLKSMISGSQGITNANNAPCFLPFSGYHSMADSVSSGDYGSALPVRIDSYIVLVQDHSPFY